MEICPYLVQGMRAIDIALLFYPMTPDAIRTNHMNIRRKLGVSTPEELRAAWEEELRAIAQANTDVQKVKQPRASEALEHSPAC